MIRTTKQCRQIEELAGKEDCIRKHVIRIRRIYSTKVFGLEKMNLVSMPKHADHSSEGLPVIESRPNPNGNLGCRRYVILKHSYKMVTLIL